MTIRVTVRDLADDTENSVEIEDDYVIVCAGDCYVSHTQAGLNGTHVLTVKGRKDKGLPKIVMEIDV